MAVVFDGAPAAQFVFLALTSTRLLCASFLGLCLLGRLKRLRPLPARHVIPRSKVSSLGGDNLVADRFAAFGERHANALLGYLSYATAAATKLEERRVKTIACAGAMLRVHFAMGGHALGAIEQQGRYLRHHGIVAHLGCHLADRIPSTSSARH